MTTNNGREGKKSLFSEKLHACFKSNFTIQNKTKLLLEDSKVIRTLSNGPKHSVRHFKFVAFPWQLLLLLYHT